LRQRVFSDRVKKFGKKSEKPNSVKLPAQDYPCEEENHFVFDENGRRIRDYAVPLKEQSEENWKIELDDPNQSFKMPSYLWG